MKFKFLILILIMLCAFRIEACAFADTPPTLQECISDIEKKFNVTFSYDSDLIKGVPVNADSLGATLEEVVKNLSERTAFDFELSEGNTVLLKPKYKGANFKLTGKISDNENNENLEGGLITNEKNTFARPTDAKGEFTIYTNYSEGDRLLIKYLGYKTVSIPFDYFISGKSTEIKMLPDVMNLEEVVLTTYMSSGIQYNRLYNNLEIKPENLSLLPGQTDADLLLSLEALPGINSPDGKAGNLNIRGSSNDQTLITFDNIPIYHKGHYFGTLSPFNPKVVENLSVSRSSFTADKGGRIGGAIDIKTKQSIPDSMMSGVSLSTIDAAAYTHIPLVKNKLSLMLAGRTAYPFNWQSPKLKAISDFVFQESELNKARSKKDGYDLRQFNFKFNDVNTKLIFKPNAKQKVTLSLLKIFNEMKTDILQQPTRTMTKDSIGFNNWGVSGQWENWWTEKIVSRVSATNSYYIQRARHGTAVLPDSMKGLDESTNSARDLSVNLETDFYGKGKHFWKTGYNISHHDILFQKTSTTPQQVTTDFINKKAGSIHSVYGSYNLMLYKIHTSIGLRSNYYSVTDKVNFEPRVTANYLINNAITLKSSWGIQKQFVTQVPGLSIETFGSIDNLLWVLADGDKIPVVKSNQVMTGAMYEKKGWLVDFEFYYKTANNLTVINIKDFTSANQFFYGSSYTVGGDLLVKKRWKKLDIWASYTLSDSKMQFDSIQAEPFTSLINQKHVLDLDILYRLGKFKFSAGWKYRSGLTAIPGIRTKLLHGIAPNNAPPPGPGPGPGGPPVVTGNKEYLDHYPSFHQLDISIVYDFPTKRKQWNGSVGVSLLNVYNRKNIIEQFRRPGQGNTLFVANKYSMGFAPNLFVSFNF
jgi:hypothetical protein